MPAATHQSLQAQFATSASTQPPKPSQHSLMCTGHTRNSNFTHSAKQCILRCLTMALASHINEATNRLYRSTKAQK